MVCGLGDYPKILNHRGDCQKKFHATIFISTDWGLIRKEKEGSVAPLRGIDQFLVRVPSQVETDFLASSSENQTEVTDLVSVKKATPSLPSACRSPKKDCL